MASHRVPAAQQRKHVACKSGGQARATPAKAASPLANSYRYSYYPGADVRQPDRDPAVLRELAPFQNFPKFFSQSPTYVAKPANAGSPYWVPDDYHCERDSNGLCIVDPILSPDKTYHQEIQNHYELREKLGEGSFGVVYAARDRRSGEQVACKSVKKAGLTKGTALETIRQEVQIMHLVAGHRNVVNIKATYEDEEHVHIVMDLCRGGHLLTWLEEHGPLDERTAARMTLQMAQMLHHCHNLNIIHRDIKPENFLLTETDIYMAEIKAADFGLSKMCEPGRKYEADLGGTPYYLAPEQIDGAYDCKADLWGLGVTLYECLCARPPFVGVDLGDTDQVLAEICKGHLDLHTGVWRHVSDSAKDLILWLLHRNPEMRASAADVLAHPWLQLERQRQWMEAANEAVLHKIDSHHRLETLKQRLLCVVGRCLPRREVLGAERLFQLLDRDCDGRVTLSELRSTARRGHWAFTEEDLERSIAYAEAASSSPTLSFDEFVATTLTARHLTREWLLSAAFRHLDADHSGDISPAEMSAGLTFLGMDAEHTRDMMYAASASGHLNYEQFVMLVRDTRQEPYHIPRYSARNEKSAHL